MDHFDVSAWAFEKLADLKWGVMGIKYRQGDSCDEASAAADWCLVSGLSGSRPEKLHVSQRGTQCNGLPHAHIGITVTLIWVII